MIPDTGISKIVGLLQIVSSNGGKMPVEDIAQAYSVELETLLLAVDGAQLLGLANSREGNVELSSLGKKIVAANIAKRKRMIKKQLANLESFKILSSVPEAGKGRKAHKRHFIHALSKYHTKKEAEKQFRKLVEWGRYAQAVNYNADTDEVELML